MRTAALRAGWTESTDIGVTLTRYREYMSGEDLPVASTSYRMVVPRLTLPNDPDFWAVVAAGWDLHCCKCDAILGHLFLPFSGGYIIHGSTAHLDPRLGERGGRETRTGKNLPRYGPPARVFQKGKGQRLARTDRPGVSASGSFWMHCYSCNTGQAMEPERLWGYSPPASPDIIDSTSRSERPRQER